MIQTVQLSIFLAKVRSNVQDQLNHFHRSLLILLLVFNLDFQSEIISLVRVVPFYMHFRVSPSGEIRGIIWNGIALKYSVQ